MSRAAAVLCQCGQYNPDMIAVLHGSGWTCPGCGRRWVQHQGRIWFLEPGQELPTTTCIRCGQTIADDQHCVPVLTGGPSPHVLAPDTQYVHLNCLLGETL